MGCKVPLLNLSGRLEEAVERDKIHCLYLRSLEAGHGGLEEDGREGCKFANRYAC
jgi:hypothetical protein